MLQVYSILAGAILKEQCRLNCTEKNRDIASFRTSDTLIQYSDTSLELVRKALFLRLRKGVCRYIGDFSGDIFSPIKFNSVEAYLI